MKVIPHNSFGKLTFLAALLAVGLVLWGCDQGVSETETMQQSTSETSAAYSGAASAAVANQQPSMTGKAKAVNEQLRTVSRAVAQALAGEELRQYVYSRAMERFDGETNVLWRQLESPAEGKGVPGGQSWNALVKDALPPGKARGTAHKLGNTIERAGRLMGGPVHLYWAYAENFEASNLKAPWVTFAPIGMDADNIEKYVAYDASGNKHVADEETAKERPVIVIIENERVGRGGGMQASAPAGTMTNAEKSPSGGGGGGGGSGGGSSGGGGSDDDPGVCDNVDHRESNPEVDDNYGNRPGYLAIDWLRFNRDSEGWSKGDPEFEFKVTRHYADSDEEQIHSNSEIYGMIQDDEYDDKVCFKKVLFEWKKEKHPSQYFAWHEFDGDNDTKLFTLDGSFKTPAGDFSFEEWSVTIHHNDDELGEAMIEDTEVDPVTYKGTGMPDMQLRLIE
jgi:hypothetical protein